MKIYSGRRMCDLLSSTLGILTTSHLKLRTKRVCSLHLVCILKYSNTLRVATKVTHNIQGHVLVILVEDETKVKARVS